MEGLELGLELGLVARSPAQAGSAGAGALGCQEDTTELCPALLDVTRKQ